MTKSGNQPFGDSRCGARWSGLATAHCTACHETFSSVGRFDDHRQGGACTPPAALGMTRADRSGGVWTTPMTETERNRLRTREQEAALKPSGRRSERFLAPLGTSGRVRRFQGLSGGSPPVATETAASATIGA